MIEAHLTLRAEQLGSSAGAVHGGAHTQTAWALQGLALSCQPGMSAGAPCPLHTEGTIQSVTPEGFSSSAALKSSAAIVSC